MENEIDALLPWIEYVLGRLSWGAIGPSGVLHMLVVSGGKTLEVKIRTRAHMHLHRITV